MSVSAGSSVRVATTSRTLTAHAGAVLVRETMRALGLHEAVSAHVRLKRRARGLQRSA
jgi:hypothetical protein